MASQNRRPAPHLTCYLPMPPPLQFNRNEAGRHWPPDEDKGDDPKAKRSHKGSMFAQPNVSEEKRAHVDRVNDLKEEPLIHRTEWRHTIS